MNYFKYIVSLKIFNDFAVVGTRLTLVAENYVLSRNPLKKIRIPLSDMAECPYIKNNVCGTLN